MTLRTVALSAAALLWFACSSPRQGGAPDAGTDSGPLVGACSSPCSPNQKCDVEKHICVDLCEGLCSLGEICVNRNGVPACESQAATCGGNVCGQGQTSCVADHCSCLPFTAAPRDSCAGQGLVCHQLYNAVTLRGGACEDPRLYEFCASSCPNGRCSAHHCAAGQACTDIITATFAICARSCGTTPNPCAPDELCAIDPDAGTGACLPNAVFMNQGCTNTVTLADGGTQVVATVAGDVCFHLDMNGTPTERTPTGTCSWVLVTSDSQVFPVEYCRSPGPVAAFGACKADRMPLQTGNTCSTGLECLPLPNYGPDGGNDGICLATCNAVLTTDGSRAQPACPAGASCVNFHRSSDGRAVPGACMTSCNVFSTQPNYGCPAYGTWPTSCVPTSASGVLRVSLDGTGICAPQLRDARAEGEPCVETDALRGAACQSGLVCAQISGEAQPRCVKPCDVGCVGEADAGVLARCATEANAGCAGGRTCTQAIGTSGAVLGFCL